MKTTTAVISENTDKVNLKFAAIFVLIGAFAAGVPMPVSDVKKDKR